MLRQKNILIFSIAYMPFVGGAEVAVKEITDRLLNYEFDMLTARLSPKLPRFEKIGNVNVYRLGFGSGLDKYLFPFAACLKALSLNRKRSYALSWAIMAAYAGFAGLFFKLFRPGTPFLLTLQEGDPLPEIERKVRFIRPIFKRIFLKADHIQAISNFLADWARKIGYKGALSVVPNGVDVQKFKIQSASWRTKFKAAKEKLNIKDEERVIITVSRLVKKNGVEDLVRAVSESRIKNQPSPRAHIEGESRIKLLIIGVGELEEHLRGLTKKLNLEDNILFLGDISHKDLPQYLWISDIFVRSSLSEGLGNAFLEAMAAGVPVIGTKVGGIPDFLIDGETGLFCEVQNPQSIAEKIETLLKDENLRLRLIENGGKLVEEKYNWDFIAQEMKNIFDKLT